MVPFVIAHRGDSAHRPENTLASFASALELGVEVMELDVQLTRDGHVIVLHDPTLDRTTTGRGSVRDLTLAQVRSVSVISSSSQAKGRSAAHSTSVRVFQCRPAGSGSSEGSGQVTTGSCGSPRSGARHSPLESPSNGSPGAT